MLVNLFLGLTGRPKRGKALFAHAVAEARRPLWYEECGVPDTIDGRFAMLSTICALLVVRLESGGAGGESASAALTERFIEAMDAEHRQMGLNDPGLGRRVRKLVGALARRVDQWRFATGGEGEWGETILSSVYRDADPAPAAFEQSQQALRDYWRRLSDTPEQQLVEGQF